MSTLLLNSCGINTKKGACQIRDKLFELDHGKYMDKTFFVVSLPEYELEDVVKKNFADFFNISKEKIYMSSEEIPKDIIPDYLCVTEGNTFDILKYMRLNGLDTYIKTVLADKPEATYIGSSAGAMIAGTDIMLALDFEANHTGMCDYTSLGLFDGTIIPHCDSRGLENYKRVTAEHILNRYNCIYAVSNDEVLVLEVGKLSKGEITDNVGRSSKVTALRMYGPAKEEEIYDLSQYIADEGLLRFYEYTSGCIVRNGNGEIRIISATQLLIDLSKPNRHIGLISIGYITSAGELYINTDGSILLYETGDHSRIKGKWNNIEELLAMDFS